jgi:RimJ/RimL family protein N-acetyltransferase
VLEENHGARAFYEKIGLRREGGEGFTRGFGGGVELAEIQYRMRLCTRVA